MQQFVVPQFIDVEDKIIGPITVRQFLILLAGSGVLFVMYRLSDFTLFVIEFIVTAPIFFAFAFIKVNGRPLHYLVLNIIQTFQRPNLRVWQKKVTDAELKKKEKTEPTQSTVQVPVKTRVRPNRLAELALVVDTGGIYQGEQLPLPSENGQKAKEQ